MVNNNFIATKQRSKAGFSTKVATASTVNNKLTLTGVADRSLSTAKFLYSPGSTGMTALTQSSNHSHASFRVDKVQTHSRSRKSLKDARMKDVVNKLFRIHATFIT